MIVLRALLLKLFSVESSAQFFHWQLLLTYVVVLVMFGAIAYWMRFAYRSFTGSAKTGKSQAISLFIVLATCSFMLVWNPFSWLGIVPVVAFSGLMALYFLFSIILSVTALKKA